MPDPNESMTVERVRLDSLHKDPDNARKGNVSVEPLEVNP